MSHRFLEQRINVKFCVKLVNNARNTCAMFSNAYGKRSLEKSSVFEWHRRFAYPDHKCSLVSSIIKDIVYFGSISQGQTVNQAYYKAILKRLCEAVGRTKPEIWPSDWILHHDNAPTHKALSIKQFLTPKSITEMGHTLCSLGLAPNGCFQK
jgi:hypothetical protein